MSRSIGIALAIALAFCLAGCSQEDAASVAVNAIKSSSAADEAEEVIYADDEDINAFILRYNEVYPDDPITAEEVSKYHHHGSDHDDQIITTVDDVQWTISSEGLNKVSVFFKTAQGHGDAEANCRIFGVVMRTFDPDLTKEEIEGLWNEVLEFVGTSGKLSNGIEVSTGYGISDDPGRYGYMKITGPTPE